MPKKNHITDAEIEEMCNMLGLRTWNQGDDGFGGEWVVNPESFHYLKAWFHGHGWSVAE